MLVDYQHFFLCQDEVLLKTSPIKLLVPTLLTYRWKMKQTNKKVFFVSLLSAWVGNKNVPDSNPLNWHSSRWVQFWTHTRRVFPRRLNFNSRDNQCDTVWSYLLHLEPADTGLQPQDGSSAQDGDDGPSPPSPHFHHLMCFWTKLLINENFFSQRPPTLGPGHKVPSLTYRRIRLAKCSHMNDFRAAFSSSAVHHSCLHFSVLSGGGKKLCNTPFPFISCNSGCFFLFLFLLFLEIWLRDFLPYNLSHQNVTVRPITATNVVHNYLQKNQEIGCWVCVPEEKAKMWRVTRQWPSSTF